MTDESPAVSPDRPPVMRVDIVTIFPSFFVAPFEEGLLGRARKSGKIDLRVHDLRKWALDRHRSTDDEVYGGGAGMAFLAGPIFGAVDEIAPASEPLRPRMIFLSPQGRRFDQKFASELSKESWLLLLCARYEGVDERVIGGLPFEEISIGDFVVMGGESPALVVLEAVGRLVPDVVGDPDSVRNDSFSRGLLDYPHYTRPEEFRGLRVPEVLLGGHHEKIRLWRLKESLRATLRKRPDLLGALDLDDEARRLLTQVRREEELRRK